MSALTSDIERALQNAIGEANNAFSVPEDTAGPGDRHNKGKKRAREDDNEPDVDVNTEKRKRKDKKKKKKKHGIREEQVEGDQQGTELVADELPKKKKKKSKRDKDKQPAVAPPAEEQEASAFTSEAAFPQSQYDSQTTSSTNPDPASNAAFLSALVTAASESQHASNETQHQGQQGQYMPYQPMGYQYPQFGHDQPPAPSFQQQEQQASMYSAPMGVPLNDLAYGSNEDILRALQDLDMTKIANVLKTLGEAAAAANIHQPQPHPPGFLGAPPGQGNTAPPPPVNQRPTTAGDILLNSSSVDPKPSQQDRPQSSSQSRPGHNRVLDMNLPGPEQHMDANHAYILANKWMNANKLAEMVKNQGLIYKKGKFSAIEEAQLKAAIDQYRALKDLNDNELSDIIFKADKGNKDTAFWSDITSAVPQRPIIAVYHHVRRTYHPLKQQGKWMPSEDALLIEAVADLGQSWEKVSARVGRMSSDCRDRYRNHIANREVRVTGQWKKEEEEELTRIVTEITIQQGRDVDNDVFWGVVSARMGNKRGRQQCRIKWTDSLSKTVKNEGQKPRWSQQDAYILVHKVDSLNVRDDTEIDWKTLPDVGWNFWSAHSLQRRWLTLKRSIKGFEEMTHAEIMDILRHKKAQLPVPPITSSKKRKIITSTASVADSDVADGGVGSSTGPGTLQGA